MNYRSVVVLGRARDVTKREEKRAALAAIVEHVVPGRGEDARRPSDEELGGTFVVAVPLTEASAKIRAGPPKDFDADLELPVWAGVIPLSIRAGKPETQARVPTSVSVPTYVADYARSQQPDGRPPRAS
jgi:uncharacterized protein